MHFPLKFPLRSRPPSRAVTWFFGLESLISTVRCDRTAIVYGNLLQPDFVGAGVSWLSSVPKAWH